MKRWIAPIAAAAIALAPAAAFAQTSKPDSATPSAKINAETFVQKALQSGEKEERLAKLAATKAKSAEVKQFAQMIAADHQRVNEQLRLLARQGTGPDRNATAPGSGPNQTETPPSVNPGAAPSQSDEEKKLAALSGDEFERAFLDMMVEAQEKSVDLYEDAAQTLPVGAPKKLADDTLPRIKQHLEQAKSLRGEADEEKK